MSTVWKVIIPGYRPFSMVLMDGPQSAEKALEEVRLIWPGAEVSL